MNVVESPASVGVGSILVGRYRLDELVGEGGMSRVFRAEDLALERTVAVKIMHAATDGSPARVRTETKLLASLGHPSLVTLYDAHIASTGPSFLVMEYVEGATLAARLADGPLPAAEVAALAIDLAEALHAVHAKNVVHRDIKPSNVLIWPSPLPDRTFRAKLTDFGIAYLIDSTRVTSPGTVIGTAAYLAPEQVRGEAPSPAADIYSLGLVLLESLTGVRAFGNALGHEAIVARLTTSPSIPDDTPEPWRVLFAAMTAPDPARRPTALQVALAATALRGQDASTGTIVSLITDPTVAAPAVAELEPTSHPDVPTEASPAPDARRGPDPTLVLAQDDDPPVPAPAPARRRRGFTAVLLVCVGLAVAAAIAIGVAFSTQQPEPAPALPGNVEPLGTHLQQLLDEVSP
ncbi:serine/threonine-protein kinase [Microbacterium sp. SS28]|uniref:serine/threonine-protein kinase n=1 Tax=Microbacterium sp. SS28 TaxID=2919948 RepID=UPI001FAA0582|nr:serine/threonine-protein kinase [Microbacterium sp. SS28]